MIDITCAILSMNIHFDIKRHVNILCKIPSDSNARDIILYCDFFNAVLGRAIRTLPCMNEKHSPTFLRKVLDVCVPRVSWRSTWKLVYCFLIVPNGRQILTMVCKVLNVPFEWGIYIYIYTHTTGQKYGIFWSPMETLVLDILICWKWLGTNHNQVLSL